MRYEVIARFSEIVEVEANNEDEAIDKARMKIKNIGINLTADEYEVECLDEEEE